MNYQIILEEERLKSFMSYQPNILFDKILGDIVHLIKDN